MRRIFLDTNILIDLIADRQPYSKAAIEIVKKAEEGVLELYTSSHALATCHYLLKKYVKEKDLRDILLSLSELVNIIPVDIDIIRKGLRSAHKDFEDAIQIGCAGSIAGMECIITRNVKDFKGSDVPVMTADGFCLSL
jgi:predicted nucleic acid-binding protein